MAEAADNTDRSSEMDQIPESSEFIVERITKLETPFFSARVYHGHKPDGKPDTWVSLKYAEESQASKGLLSNLTKSPLGRIAAGITMSAAAVVGAGAALSACSSGPNVPVQPSAEHGGHGVQQSAITLDNLLNVGPGQKIPWSIDGYEQASNAAGIEGEQYIFFTDNWAAFGEKGVNYVKCQAIEDCLSADAEIQSVQGFADQDMIGPFWGPGAFQDQQGNDKLVIGSGGSYAKECDVDPNEEGLLEVSNCTEIVPLMYGSPSVFTKNEIPLALFHDGELKLQNLHSDEIQEIPYKEEWASACGVGVETASAVVASQMQFYQGVTHCRIVVGSSWEQLVKQPIPLNSLNKISGYLTSVRIAGPYLIFTNDYNLWFAVIPIDSENPESSETGAETSNADATQPDVPVVDGPDAVDGPETSGADANEAETSQGGTDTANPEDVTEDVANAADAAVDAAVDPADSDSQTGDGSGSELPQPEDTGDGEVDGPDNGPSDDPGEADKDAESEPPVEPAPEPQPEPAPEPQPEPTPELDEDTSTEQDPEKVPEPAPEQTPESNPEPVTPAEPQPEQTPSPEPQPEPSPEPANTPEPAQSSDAGSSAETANPEPKDDPEPEKQPQPVPWKTVEVDGGCAAVVEHGKPTDPLTHLTPLALSLLTLGATARRRIQQTLQAVRERLKHAA